MSWFANVNQKHCFIISESYYYDAVFRFCQEETEGVR